MSVKSVVSYVAVFVAGALAVGAFVVVTDPPQTQSPEVAASETVSSDQTSVPDSTETEESMANNETVAVTPIGDLMRNTPVTIAGVVDAVTDEDEFRLVDETGSVTVWTRGTFFAVSPGEQVTVQGFVDDDLILEVYAQQITRADGTVVNTAGGDE